MKFNITLAENTNKVSHPEIIDSLGRIIALQKPKISDNLNFLQILGAELSRNQAYVELASIVLLIKAIAGVPVIINSVTDIAATIEMLELADDAFQKIWQAAIDNFLNQEEKLNLIQMNATQNHILSH